MNTPYVITVEVETTSSLSYDTFVTKIPIAHLKMDNTQLLAEWGFAWDDDRVSRYVRYEEDDQVNCVTVNEEAHDRYNKDLTVEQFTVNLKADTPDNNPWLMDDGTEGKTAMLERIAKELGWTITKDTDAMVNIAKAEADTLPMTSSTMSRKPDLKAKRKRDALIEAATEVANMFFIIDEVDDGETGTYEFRHTDARITENLANLTHAINQGD